MARTFPENFAAHQTDRNSWPYLVLEIHWQDETLYYLDRRASDFQSSGVRMPAEGVADELVESWGALTVSLKEQGANSFDGWSVKIIDPDQNLRAKLNATASQRRIVKLYRMWDEDDCQWTDDKALIFCGSLRPNSWSEQDSVVTIEVEDASKRLLRTIDCPAQISIFPTISEEYRDKNIPLVWGQAHRVPAVLVQQPWATVSLKAIPRSSDPPFTIPIDTHPDDMGSIDLGSPGDPIAVWLGTDLVEGYLVQSESPDTEPSSFVVMDWLEVTNATAVINYAFDTGSSRFAVLNGSGIFPSNYRLSLTDLVAPGTACLVMLAGNWVSATVDTIDADEPWPGAYKITFTDSAINEALQPGGGVKFLSDTTADRTWPAGTALRPQEGIWIYACNALPSKQVVKVEGYGSIPDDAGESRKGFVLLGGSITDGLDGSVPIEDEVHDPYEVNLNDDTWEDDLERRITTVTFNEAPRTVNPSLEDNRIWVTLQGVEDGGDSEGILISNPALVILQYLENEFLMDVSIDDIDVDSFTDAATALNTRALGFAQLEAMDGLKQLQECCRQFRSILFFDQGKAQIKVLSNSADTIAGVFTNHNIEANSIKYQETSADDLVSRLKAKWRSSWDDKTNPYDILAINSGTEEEFGLVPREFELDVYARRNYGVLETQFWLTRWSRIYREVEFTTFGHGLHLQPADWITLHYLEGPRFFAQDLTVHASINTRVSSASHTFTSDDVGKKLLVCEGTDWTVAIYTINSVTSGSANLSGSPAAINTTGGVYLLGGDVLFNDKDCEVLEVSDDPMAGTVRVKCRYPVFSF